MNEGGLPLYARFPALAALPRAELGVLRSPVQRLAGDGDDPPLWIKRDDLDAPDFGGNKVRALEFLLGGVGRGTGDESTRDPGPGT